MQFNLINGDCLVQLKNLADNSIDSIVTDPPYGLSFMGKSWDYEVPSEEIWKECFRVLKHGGHLLAFFGTRTYHRGVVRIEDAGFEIRDQIQWIYGSGFPKSTNVALRIEKESGAIGNRGKGFNAAGQGISLNQNKELRSDHPDYIPPKFKTPEAIQWKGWGTALKPASEPIVVARKPLEKGLTVAQNVLKWGTGALNIDESRIEGKLEGDPNRFKKTDGGWGVAKFDQTPVVRSEGRWPANVIFDEVAAEMLDEQSGVLKSGELKGYRAKESTNIAMSGKNYSRSFTKSTKSEGGASRFFKVISEDKNDISSSCKTTNVNNAENSSKTTMAIDQDKKTSSVLENVTQFLDSLSLCQNAKSATKNAKNIELDSVLEVVRMLNRTDLQLQPCQDFTLNSKNSTLIHNLVLIAESSENTDIIQTIQSLLKLCGSAHLVTGENIKLENLKSNNGPTRFLYQAKASKSERNRGLEGMPLKEIYHQNNSIERKELNSTASNKSQNNHPTVKPVKLMQYLIKLVTPPSGIVLDPFMGSGSTGVAAKELGFSFIGIERDTDYFKIAETRIKNFNPTIEIEESKEDQLEFYAE